MIVTIAGAPGSGKKALAQTIAEEYGLTYFGVNEEGPLALGSLSDYRTELAMATSRTLELTGFIVNSEDVVLTHSLLDCVIYASARLSLLSVYTPDELTLERWILTYMMVSQIARDTWSTDLLVFLKGNDGTEFGAAIERAFETFWTKYDQPVYLAENVDDALKHMKEFWDSNHHT